MAYRDSPFQELKVPLTWTSGVALVLALVVAVSIFVYDRKDQAKVSADALGHTRTRAGFDMVLAPVSGVLATPIHWINDSAGSLRDYFFAVSENHKLRKQVEDLQQVRIDDIALRNLNRRYEELLRLRTEPPIPMVTGRVVSDTHGPFSDARLIDVGTGAGVKIGNPAMNELGVVGRVVGVSPNASRLLLLTDPESRTPVLVDRTNARAVLTGDGGGNPRLEFMRGKDPVKNGDRVLTSGDGGLYPRGLPIGVAQQDVRGVWRVRLYSDNGAIDFVRVLFYDDFSQGLDQAKLAETALPPLSPEDAAKLKAAETAQPVSANLPSAARPSPSTPSPARATPAPDPARPRSASRANPLPDPDPGSNKTSAARRPVNALPGPFRRVHTPDPSPPAPPGDPDRGG